MAAFHNPHADGYHPAKGGKTVHGLDQESIEAHEDKALGPLIAPHLRTLLYELNRMAGVGNKARRGLAVLRSFAGALKVTVGNVSFFNNDNSRCYCWAPGFRSCPAWLANRNRMLSDSSVFQISTPFPRTTQRKPPGNRRRQQAWLSSRMR